MRALLLLMLVACGAPAAAPAQPQPITSDSPDEPPPSQPPPPPVVEAPAEAETPPEPIACDRAWQDAEPLAEEVVDEALARGLVEVSELHRQIDRGLAGFVLEHLDAWPSKGARVMDSSKNGKANGMKLYAVRPSSTYARLGLKNGDTIHAINGQALRAHNARCLIEAALAADAVVLELTRRGKPVRLTFELL